MSVSEDPRRIKVTKGAERKVNLRGISSEYDNISRSTFLSTEIEFYDDEDFEKQCKKLAERAAVQTENDIRKELLLLKILSKDVDNDCLLGNGYNLEYTEEEENMIRGLLDTIIKKNNTADVPEKEKQKEEKPKKEPEEDDDDLFNDIDLDIDEGLDKKEVPGKERKVDDEDLADELFGKDEEEKPKEKTNKKEEPKNEEEPKKEDLPKKEKKYEDIDLEEFNFDDFSEGLLSDDD